MSAESLKLVFLSFVTTVSLVLTANFVIEKENRPAPAKPADKGETASKTDLKKAQTARQSYAS